MSDTEVDAIPADRSITENKIPVKEEIYNRISDRELSDCHPNDPKILHRKSVVLENLVHFVFVVSTKDFNKYTELLRWFKEIERTVEKKGHDLKYETQDSRLFKYRYDEKVHDISEKAIFILPLLSEFFMEDAFCRFFNTEVIGKTRLDDTCDEGIMGSILKEQKQDAVRPIFLTHGTAKLNRPPGFLMMKGIDYYDKETNMEYVQNQIKDIIEEAIERVEKRRNAMVDAAFTKRDTTFSQIQTSDSMANLSTAVENVSIGNIGSSTTTSESVALLEMENGSSRHIQGYNTCENSRDQDQDLADRAFSADSGARRRKDIGPNIRNAVKVDVDSSVQSELKEKQPGKRNKKKSYKSVTTVNVFKDCTNIQVGDGSVIVMKEEKRSTKDDRDAPVDRVFYERNPRYPRQVDEKPVDPNDLIHFVFVYAKEDHEKFVDFLGWFEEITVESGHTVKFETHESEHFPCPYDDNVHDISERAIFILPFLSKSFCTDKALQFFTSEAIGMTRLDQTWPKGALETTVKKQKKYAVRPIHTADSFSGTYHIPTGLTMMRGIEFYSKDKHVGYDKDQVIRIINEAIKKYEERKRAMVNVPTTSENEMANMLPAMKNVTLNPVTTQNDTSLEVDSGPTRQHNNTTCRMALGQKPDNLDDELKKLDALLKKSKYNNLRVEDVPRDGDCLYHTFIRNNHIHELPDSPKELRRRLVKFLESNPNTPDGVSYRDFLCLPLDQDHGILEPEDMAIERVENLENQKELRWQRFLKKVHKGEWGGSLEILGLSKMYDVPVTVLSVTGFRLIKNKFNHNHKTTRNSVIYIGHLRLNRSGAHFVALRPREEEAFQQPASFQQGEPLRKRDDNSFPYLEGQIIYKEEHSKRIGCIRVTLNGKECHGTGFLVGSKYFMTAFHVMEDVLIPFWEDVYRRLTKEEREKLEWTEDKIPVDGAWGLSFVDPNKRNDLMKIGEESITNRVQIKFRFVKDIEDSFFARCSYDVAFASPSHDVVILELIEYTNLPNPFHLKTINAAATRLHLIGHPGGKKLEHDPACKIIRDQKELVKLVEDAISFFTAQGYREDQVKENYKPCVLSPDHLLFHCSTSITHGASGSPLIVIINEEKAQVIGMLLRGHPKFYYNYDKSNGDRPDLLVELGISMEKVRLLLKHHSLHELAKNLFPEPF